MIIGAGGESKQPVPVRLKVPAEKSRIEKGSSSVSRVHVLRKMQNTTVKALGGGSQQSCSSKQTHQNQGSSLLGDIGHFFSSAYHDGVQWGKDAGHFVGSVVSKNPEGAVLGGLSGTLLGPLGAAVGIIGGAAGEGAVHQFSTYPHSDSHLPIQVDSSNSFSSEQTAGLRAKASANALIDQFSLKPTGMYSDTPSSGKPTSAWAESQAVNALIDTGHDNKAQQALNRLQSTYGQGNGVDPNPNVGFPQNRFYDDNSWVGQDYMQLYQKTHNPKDLQQAEKTFSFLQTGEQTTKPPDGNGACHLPVKGGMQWEENQSPQLNGTAAGAAAELGAQLYQATGNPKYKNFAEQNLHFMNQYLSDPNHPGLYDNSLNLSPQQNHGGNSQGKQIQIYNKSTHQWQTFSYSQNKSLYTYNQGTAIGADVSLYQKTHDSKYLANAMLTAQASQNYFNEVPGSLTTHSEQVIAMHDPQFHPADQTRFWQQPPSFNAIYFRNLQGLNQELAKVSKNPQDSRALQQYLLNNTIPGNSSKTYAQQLQQYSHIDLSSSNGIQNYARQLNNNSRGSLQNYLDKAWNQARNNNTGLFTKGGIGHYGKAPGTLLDQSGFVQMYSLLSSWPSE